MFFLWFKTEFRDLQILILQIALQIFFWQFWIQIGLKKITHQFFCYDFSVNFNNISVTDLHVTACYRANKKHSRLFHWSGSNCLFLKDSNVFACYRLYNEIGVKNVRSSNCIAKKVVTDWKSLIETLIVLESQLDFSSLYNSYRPLE